MTNPQVTVLIPNYKTADLTRLCLRLLKKYTDAALVKILVIDNDSQDASLDYLRSLKGITLIERPAVPNEGAISAHSRALDLALATVTTPYVLSIHTDTLVKHPKWLPFLLSEIEKNPAIAGVGSWKLENKPLWRRALKKIERFVQQTYYKLTNNDKHGLEGVGKNYYYLRSHCALYRMEVLRKLNLHFSDGDLVAGKYMHKAIVEAGYEMVFLPSDVLIPYMDHINHATTVLNPALSTREKSVTKGMKRIRRALNKLNAKGILLDETLDW